MLRRTRSGQSCSTSPTRRSSSTSAYAAAGASSSSTPCGPGARRERLTVNPSAHRAGQAVDAQRRVVVPGLRFGQRLERADHRRRARAGADVAHASLVGRLPLVRPDEIEQRVELCRRPSAPRAPAAAPRRPRPPPAVPRRRRRDGRRRVFGDFRAPAVANAACPASAVKPVPAAEVLQLAKTRIERVHARPDRHERARRAPETASAASSSRSTVDARFAAATMNAKTTSSAAANGSAASGSESSAWYG